MRFILTSDFFQKLKNRSQRPKSMKTESDKNMTNFVFCKKRQQSCLMNLQEHGLPILTLSANIIVLDFAIIWPYFEFDVFILISLSRFNLIN